MDDGRVQIKNLGCGLIGYKLGSEKPNIVSLKVVFFIKGIVLYFSKDVYIHLATSSFLSFCYFPYGILKEVHLRIKLYKSYF